MTDQELKKLSRRELLEMLIVQTRRVEKLERLLEEANAKLADRTIQIADAGSLSEAVMRLNGVFEAAQAAADQYLENIRRMQQRAEETHEE